MFILLVAAQAVSPPPRLPPVAVPPPVYIPTPTYSSPISRERYVVDVEVRAGNLILWSGPLRVGGGYGQTSVRRDQSEPGDSKCGNGEELATATNSVSLTLSPRGRNDALSVNVRWSRPGDLPCGLGPNSRTVELSSAIALAPGESKTIAGDGGLMVRLQRR